MKTKYRFKTRQAAEDAHLETDRLLTMTRIALIALENGEFTWTERFQADNGAWFQAGFARPGSPSGGYLLWREHHPVNKRISVNAHYADDFVRDMGAQQRWVTDDETRCFWDCFESVRSMYQKAVAAA